MNYNSSVTDFFKSPAWGRNLMFGALALIIPVVGPIVLTGWHVSCFWARGNHHEPAGFPPFDFQYFGKYLERGLWPFIVNLVASLVLVPLVMCSFIPIVIFSGIFEAKSGGNAGAAFGVVFAGIFLVQITLMLVYQMVSTPLVLRAMITQDFQSSFDAGFVKDFLARMWKELLATMLFMFGIGLCLMVLAVITCYIGGIAAAPVAVFAWHHLQSQLYQVYLSRGGRTVPPSPKLNDLPPPLPAA